MTVTPINPADLLKLFRETPSLLRGVDTSVEPYIYRVRDKFYVLDSSIPPNLS